MLILESLLPVKMKSLQCPAKSSRKEPKWPLTNQRMFRHVSYYSTITGASVTVISVLGQVAHPPEVHSNNSGAQNQHPKPRIVHNASGGQSDTDNTCNLHSRIHPTGSSAVEETMTMATTSARLMAAEEGLIGQARDLIQGGCIDPPLSVDASGHQETRLPDPTGMLYDAANPFTHPLPPPKRLPEPHPGPGVRSLYLPQLDVSQGDNLTKYNTGWYTPQHGPYLPMPYMLPHYRHAYPPGNPHGPPFHPQLEHTVHGDPNASRYHDTYYNGGNDPYTPYPGHAHYPFYPPPPPQLCTGLTPHPDGHATLLVHTILLMIPEVTRKCISRIPNQMPDITLYLSISLAHPEFLFSFYPMVLQLSCLLHCTQIDASKIARMLCRGSQCNQWKVAEHIFSTV